MNQENQNKLLEIVKKSAGKDVSKVEFTESTLLTKHLGYDSIKVVQLIVDIEETFGIAIEDDDLDFDVLLKYGSLQAFIAERLAEANGNGN